MKIIQNLFHDKSVQMKRAFSIRDTTPTIFKEILCTFTLAI